MSILKVARMGHPVLRAKTRPLDPAEISSPAIQKLIDDMAETMHEYRGIGLAAPQVHQPVRLFLAGIVEEHDGEGEDDPPMKLLAIINPEITPLGRDTEEDWEGCLSIPDIRGLVPRARRIRVRGFDREARRIEMELQGYPARVVQHEADHLDGVLFLDRMRTMRSLTYLEEYARFKGD